MKSPDFERTREDDPDQYLGFVERMRKDMLNRLNRGDLREDPDFAVLVYDMLERLPSPSPSSSSSSAYPS